MAAISGQRLANLTKKTLTKISSDQSLYQFYASRKSEGLLGEPERFQESDALWLDWRLVLVRPIYPQTADDQFRRVHYEAIDLIVSAIYQESFRSYVQMETLLVKAANGDDYEADFKFLEASSYSEDVDTEALHGHATKYFGSYVKEKTSCFDETLLAVLKFPEPEKKLIQELKLSVSCRL